MPAIAAGERQILAIDHLATRYHIGGPRNSLCRNVAADRPAQFVEACIPGAQRLMHRSAGGPAGLYLHRVRQHAHRHYARRARAGRGAQRPAAPSAACWWHGSGGGHTDGGLLDRAGAGGVGNTLLPVLMRSRKRRHAGLLEQRRWA